MKDLVPLFQIDLLGKWEAAREKIWKDAEEHYEQTLKKMKKDLNHLVYLCAPLKPTKSKLIQNHISDAILAASQILGAEYNGKRIILFVPHIHVFSIYNEIIYPQVRERAIKFNDWLIQEHFHTLVVIGERISEGMASEIEQARKNGTEVIKIKDFKKQLKHLPDSKKSKINYRKMINLHNKIHGDKFLIK
ncbi:MAG: hypothetical protein A3B47_01420 [Candidatus Levybacteria bacterium RIFCSPLOWO2_01_FULL_39_24]|nr:MAG: hypothetical protein A2800_00010 [Candidatus Levybacteria bacterium RIFCSPHIGHO2_01_FULL_40_16]OGH27804.1 MAG: hypothetical protein A3E12_00355 [Candidatus Levybacteria bacterium RIFCSPHIGHO2_12_FULL_39_9]OGH46078.1 MAG: hypothetical protein A3B47_01420 [Candidatus Levybacteria bacterium RIFCSPLOWO2_01_FULL_39_24]